MAATNGHRLVTEDGGHKPQIRPAGIGVAVIGIMMVSVKGIAAMSLTAEAADATDRAMMDRQSPEDGAGMTPTWMKMTGQVMVAAW
jgi:hypothetical protein